MLRERITHNQKAADAFYKAAQAMTTGMGVVKKQDNTFDFPAAETGANLFWIQKERIPAGANAARLNLSDYDPDFVQVAKEERAVLYQFSAGERFATDAYADALSDADVGQPLVVGTDGKVTVSSSASLYRFAGFCDDAGHKLAEIEVLDTPAAAS